MSFSPVSSRIRFAPLPIKYVFVPSKVKFVEINKMSYDVCMRKIEKMKYCVSDESHSVFHTSTIAYKVCIYKQISRIDEEVR